MDGGSLDVWLKSPFCNQGKISFQSAVGLRNMLRRCFSRRGKAKMWMKIQHKMFCGYFAVYIQFYIFVQLWITIIMIWSQYHMIRQFQRRYYSTIIWFLLHFISRFFIVYSTVHTPYTVDYVYCGQMGQRASVHINWLSIITDRLYSHARAVGLTRLSTNSTITSI